MSRWTSRIRSSTHGKVSHGRLGVTIQEVNQALADNFGMKTPGGALVSSVQKDSPAAKAGVEPGDVIVKFDGKDITSSSQICRRSLRT